MPPERDLQRQRAAQVGALLRTYREAFQQGPGRRGLTQEQLLRRMADANSEYVERYSHTTVSRWESGQTRPSLERLLALGNALELSQAEVAGLILLAGLAPDFATALAHAQSSAADIRALDASTLSDTSPLPEMEDEAPPTPAPLSPIKRPNALSLAFRFVPLAAAVVAIGYALGSLGWDNTWMPLVYVGLVISLVLIQGLVFPDKEAGLRDFYWVSLFVLLTSPLIQFARLGMDHFGFWTIGHSFGTHLPYMFTLLANLAMCAVAGVAFQYLRRWQYGSGSLRGTPLRRAAWTVLPPAAFIYLMVFLFSNISIWVQLAVLVPVVAAFVGISTMLRDPTVRVSESDRTFMLWATLAVAIVSVSLGIFTILVIYASPTLPMVLPDHNLFLSWEGKFAQSGFTRDEARALVNVCYVWHAVITLIYMVFIAGGGFIADIFRSGPGSQILDTGTARP